MAVDPKKTSKPGSVLPVLLTFLPTNNPSSLLDKVDRLQSQVAGKIQVINVETKEQPIVFKSFGLTHLPAFVLIYQGIELWRQEGLPQTDLLDLIPADLLQE